MDGREVSDSVPDDRRTTIRQKNLKHGGLVTLGDTVAFLVPVGVFVTLHRSNSDYGNWDKKPPVSQILSPIIR